MCLVYRLFLALLIISPVLAQEGKRFDVPAQVRFVRIYGSNDERDPPILLINSDKYSTGPALGTSELTIEIDIDAVSPPAMYAKFVHCGPDWREDDNVFINSSTMLRTSNIRWETAPAWANYYTYRGYLEIPGLQIDFKYSGNWKVIFYEYDYDEPFAEGRFFVTEPMADVDVLLSTDFYSPEFIVTSTAVQIEAYAQSNQQLYDSQFKTAAVYKNGRWYEPYIITSDGSVNTLDEKYRYDFNTMTGGSASFGRKFRISGLPAENGYRILELTDYARYPRVNHAVRLPFSDDMRDGSFRERDDDGVMRSSFLNPDYDDYVLVEFVLDPFEHRTRESIFISGSFNNWNPDSDWQMHFDEETRFYRLQQWVRRGRHNYLYATGRLDADTGRLVDYSYDEFEGNTAQAGHSYIVFVYYRDTQYGGYDALIGVGGANIYGTFRR